MLTVGGDHNGIGSGLLGASWAGFKPKFMLEYRDFFNLQTFRHNFPGVPWNLEGLTFEEGEQLKFPVADLIISSPDCKMFSNLGTKRKDRGNIEQHKWTEIQLFQVLIALSMRAKPKAFIVENIPNALKYLRFTPEGLIELPTFVTDDIIPAINFTDYHLQVLKLNSWDFCVPQTRRRIYIVGIKREFYKHSWIEFNNSTMPALRLQYDKLIHDHARGWLVKDGFDGIENCINNIGRPNHSQERIDGFNKLKIGESYYGTQNNKRLDPNKPAGTIASHCSRFVHPSEPRVLTVRETARLMGFPDSFKFFGSESQQLDQVGKAIVPQVAMAISFYIKTQLNG